MALATVLFSLTLPAAAHADLVQSPPTAVQGGYFDDHSIGTDNHMGWGFSGSDVEPLAITFGSTLTNAGSSAFRVCGYASGTSAGWMRAFEVSGACPGAAPTGQDGWFRYITANHDDPTRHLFNRWHLMDLQRFALVPLPTSAGGPAGASTAWDTYWGTCLSDGGQSMDCEQSAAATTLSTSITAGAAKTTQEQNPAPDAERIAIPADARFQFPDGLYQVVAIANPYGQYSGPRSVACTTISLSGMAAYAPVVSQVGGTPTTCYVPATIAAPLTGPGVGARDPMASATESECTLQTTGHCWATVPLANSDEDPLSPHPLARTNVTTANTVTPTNTVALSQAGGTTATPSSGASNPPATAAGQVHTTPTLTARLSRTYARSALRRQFGRNLSRLRVSCRVRSSRASICNVSFRTSGARYSGHLWLRYRTVNSRLRWQYRLEVKKRKSGRTQTIRRSYRTGGTL
jgi:hypothetical protein